MKNFSEFNKKIYQINNDDLDIINIKPHPFYIPGTNNYDVFTIRRSASNKLKMINNYFWYEETLEKGKNICLQIKNLINYDFYFENKEECELQLIIFLKKTIELAQKNSCFIFFSDDYSCPEFCQYDKIKSNLKVIKNLEQMIKQVLIEEAKQRKYKKLCFTISTFRSYPINDINKLYLLNNDLIFNLVSGHQNVSPKYNTIDNIKHHQEVIMNLVNSEENYNIIISTHNPLFKKDILEYIDNKKKRRCLKGFAILGDYLKLNDYKQIEEHFKFDDISLFILSAIYPENTKISPFRIAFFKKYQ
ncbi:hypothetical protein CPAV1605_241 [seawater metagenome]|uniref:Uncharacterized protein n=1 Tax=seawater metagenome TaxID=1561972 RepID=A0A5E8CHI4_9ZZZZ